MTEPPQEPRRFPLGAPGTPLPRIWKAEPDPESEPEPEKPKKKKKKKSAQVGDDPVGKAPVAKPKKGEKKAAPKAKAKAKDGDSKGALIEETPTLDTYQARQTARILTGVALFGIGCLCLFLFYRLFVPSSPVETPQVAEEAPVVVPPATISAQDYEQEARNMLERARATAKNGRAEQAVALLQNVEKKYPKSRAAGEAREALARPKQNLPLFLDRPTVVASNADSVTFPSPAPAPEPPPRVVEATKPTAPQASDGETQLVAPPTMPEPVLAANTAAPEAPVASPSKPMPRGFRMRPGSKLNPSGWPLEIVGDRDGAPMLLVPGGTFTIGRDDGESAEAPAHKVTLGTYYIDLHEVTVRQFDLFAKQAGPRRDRDRALAKDREKDKDKGADDGAESDDSPVVMVSARDAKDYATWAGKFLPTEAQWEAAARSTAARLFPWGNEPPAGKARKARQVEPIRSFPLDVAPYGAFDMAGNAWEWTKDWYDPHYFQTLKNGVADNPLGPAKVKSEQLVVKGGASNWVVTKREGLKWSTRLPYVGFRCVIQVEGPGNVFEPPTTKGPSTPAPGALNVIPF